MRIIRILGSAALWIGALLGVVAGGVWVADTAGLIKPMIVISGSMEPGIKTGDLLIARPIPTETVEPGDVLSLPSRLTGKLVTHRVISVTSDANGTWEIRMKGDANAEADLEAYTVGDEVLTPALRIPMAGKVVSKLMEPAVAMPILLSLVALLGVSLLDEQPRRAIKRKLDQVNRRSEELEELDRELAAVGVDVARFQEMDDLDLALYAVGIDVDALEPEPEHALEPEPEKAPVLTG